MLHVITFPCLRASTLVDLRTCLRYDGVSPFIPGGYPFQKQIEDAAKRDRKLNIEIENGRAAMSGVTGAMMHSCLDSCDHHFFYPITHN